MSSLAQSCHVPFDLVSAKAARSAFETTGGAGLGKTSVDGSLSVGAHEAVAQGIDGFAGIGVPPVGTKVKFCPVNGIKLEPQTSLINSERWPEKDAPVGPTRRTSRSRGKPCETPVSFTTGPAARPTGRPATEIAEG